MNYHHAANNKITTTVIILLGICTFSCNIHQDREMVQVTVLDALLSVDENGQTLDNIPRVGFTLSIENRSSNSLYVPFGEGKSDFIIEFDCMGTKN